jgi:hypothetical protein
MNEETIASQETISSLTRAARKAPGLILLGWITLVAFFLVQLTLFAMLH